MAIKQGAFLPSVSHEAGSHRGSINGYLPTKALSIETKEQERILSSERADDLYANDWGAKSSVNAIVTNSVGTGLRPQSSIAFAEVGISQEEATILQNQMEWLFSEWSQECHYRNGLLFEDLQILAVRSLVRNGEFIHLPVMEERIGDKFALKIQDIKPNRLLTPTDKKTNPLIQDGIELSETGVPQFYWLYSPKPTNIHALNTVYVSSDFKKIPAKLGHRKGIFHIFSPEYEEQVRGVSALSTGMKFFKHFNDAIDYELVAQVIAASFPVFISQEKGTTLPYSVQMETSSNGEPRYYQNIEPGSVLYGNEGEKPEILESKRPSQNFMNFCELMMRVSAASLGLPYEEVSKDFSKTTYSSARAAMIEAWRVYGVYRSFFQSHYCQPIWNMVMEEAYLRGYLKLPKHIDFYKAMPFLCNCRWIGPARGYIDPVKEISANILAIENKLMTRSEAIAERGGDFDETTNQLQYEQKQLEKFEEQKNA